MRQSTILAYGYLHTIRHSPVCARQSPIRHSQAIFFLTQFFFFFLLQKSVLCITNVGSDEVDIEHLISLVEERPVLGDKSLHEYESNREIERKRKKGRDRHTYRLS